MKKELLIVLAVLITAAAFVWLLTEYIYRQKSCEVMNIDNLELRTGIGIPEVSLCECRYDEAAGVKQVVFDIDTARVSVAGYIYENNFGKLKEGDALLTEDFFSLKKSGDDVADVSHLYFIQDVCRGNAFKMLLDRETGRLRVELKYAPENLQ